MYQPLDRHRLLVDNLPDGFAYHRLIEDAGARPVDYVFLEVNPAFEALTGFGRGHLVGRHATTALPAGAFPGLDWLSVYGRVARGGRTERFEQYAASRGRWYEVLVYSDEPGYFATVFRDMTERKMMESALRSSEARFRSLFEQSIDPISIVAPDGAGIEANQAFLDLFGYRREDLASFNVVSLYADPADRLVFLQRIAATGFVRDEVRFKRRDGTVFDCERTAVALKDPDGNVVAYQGVHHDITSRRLAERRLVEANRELRSLTARLEVAREEERAAVAWELHDEVAQTLSALKMDVAICRRRLSPEAVSALAPRMDEMTRLLDGAIARLRKVYGDLVPVMLEDLGLAAAIEWQVEGFGRRAGVRCSVRRMDDIEFPHVRMALGLFRVLQEALESVLQRSGVTRVTVDLERSGTTVTLRVADDGRNDAQSGANGAALELAGIRERVRSWGGSLDVRSSPVEGTVLEVSVPLAGAMSA